MNTKPSSKSRPLRRVISAALFSAAAFAALCAIAPLSAVNPLQRHERDAAMNKIASWVQEHTANGQQAEYLVVLSDQADLSGANELATKQEKGRFVRDALWEKAQSTQGPILKMLAERKMEHRSYYIVNLIWVRGDLNLALDL